MMKVLVIDDSPLITQQIKGVLEHEGIEIVTCNDPTEAISLFVKTKPNIVLLDNTMPMLDGIEVLNNLVKFDPHVKVIVITTIDHWGLFERYYKRGAIAHLIKPFTKESLVNTVKAPWDIYDRKIVMIFLMALNKIQDSLQRILRTETSITITKINLVLAKKTEIRVGHGGGLEEVQVKEYIEEMKLQRPQGVLCYSLEFTGQQNGYLAICTNKTFCDALIFNSKDYFEHMLQKNTEYELFDIILSNLFSTIVGLTGFILDKRCVMELDPPMVNANMRKKGVLSALCNIKTPKFEMPFELEIWGDLNNIFAKIGRPTIDAFQDKKYSIFTLYR